jgi:hypothetical protein
VHQVHHGAVLNQVLDRPGEGLGRVLRVVHRDDKAILAGHVAMHVLGAL